MHSVTGLLPWLESTQFATFIQESSWAFPMIESIHVLGITLVVGSIAVVDLRLLGLAWTNRPITEVLHETVPLTWAAFLVALICGSLMFISQATNYFENQAFRLKMLLMAGAGVNMLAFHFITARSISKWDRGPALPLAVKIAGAVSLTCWVAIVFFGRRIGFTMYLE